MRLSMKIGVYCVFGLGIVNIAFSLTRFLNIQLSDDGTAPLTTVGMFILSLCLLLFWCLNPRRF